MGRTKGGLNTKIHAVVDNAGNAVKISLTGNVADITEAYDIVEDIEDCKFVADKAYDCDASRRQVEEAGNSTCIPSKSNRKVPYAYNKNIYKKRHRVENFFQKIKRFRRVATRYDKLAVTYLSFLSIAILIVELQ